MYFSISDVKNNRSAQLAAMVASDLGECMISGEQGNVAFESAIASMSAKTNVDPVVCAAQLLNQDRDFRKKAIRVGLREMEASLGGASNMAAFFKQASNPRASIRFQSVGGVRDDINTAKNRAAALSMSAVIQRRNDPNAVNMLPVEREYVEYMKSVTRTLNEAVEMGTVDVDSAHSLRGEIEVAGYLDKLPESKTQIVMLQADASTEYFKEERARVIAKYKNVAAKDNTPSPD
jgi:hypothetical protein